MIDDKTIKSMPKREMVMSDISGKFFLASECEVIVIKIVKHKDEDVNGYNPFRSKETEPVDAKNKPDPLFNNNSVKIGKRPSSVIPDVFLSEDEKKLAALTPDKIDQVIKRETSKIPAGMVDIFSKPPGLD